MAFVGSRVRRDSLFSYGAAVHGDLSAREGLKKVYAGCRNESEVAAHALIVDTSGMAGGAASRRSALESNHSVQRA
jgi:hypothetical protein